MKIPFRYQVSEFDCAPTSIYNVISYLCTTFEVPAKVIKDIMELSMDVSYQNKEGEGGTSTKQMKKICSYVTKNLPILLEKEKSFSKILHEGGCVLYRTTLDGYDHYVLITDYDEWYYYLWDPYYLEQKEGVEVILNHPTWNRKICKNVIDSNQDYGIKNHEYYGFKKISTQY